MTLPRALGMMNQWKATPPVHWCVAALAGHKAPAKKTVSQDLSALGGMPGMTHV